MTPKRPKKCPECGEKYQPTRQMQPCCEKIDCKAAFALRHIEATQKRRRMQESKLQMADRKTTKIKLDKLKTARDWTKDAQISFNSYIRTRDSGLPCICCGKALGSNSEVGGAFDAGHYRSVGSAPHLRFDERNCHGQNKVCNRYGAGRAVDYRLGLIRRIGLGAVEALEADQQPKKYTIEELKAIKSTYVAKLKQLKSEKNQ